MLEKEDAAYGELDLTATAFRAAEKQYKLRLEEQFRIGANGRRRGGRFVAAPVDLSRALDLSGGETKGKASLVREKALDDGTISRVYALDRHPGFYYVANALSAGEQREWVTRAAKELCEPPARTNFTRELGDLPEGLWSAAIADAMLVRDGANGCAWETPRKPIKRGDANEKFLARRLLAKLRWATVGSPFNWTERVYEPNVPRRPISNELMSLTRRIARAAPENWTFDGQAGLINYYQPGDTLNAHVDDAENNLDRPIVSISLGCAGIFLLGHENRDEEPTAMVLRSGDAVILGGASRSCYHGVPRVFGCVDDPEDRESFPVPEALRDDKWDSALAEYASHTRINISIRDID